jgi:hypothetical protein
MSRLEVQCDATHTRVGAFPTVTHMGSADGSSGWMYDHITNIALSSLMALDAGTNRINLQLSGELPRYSFLLDADLIGI